MKPNPLYSRSLLLGLATLVVFTVFAGFVVASGYFDAGFAAAGLLFLSKVMDSVLARQATAEPKKPNEASKS